MQSFNYKNPTEIIFGNGRIKEIGEHLKGKVKKVLLTYGKGSIKENGVFDTVVKSLNDAGIEFVEFSGIKPNPILSHAQMGAKLAKEKNVDGILAVGGGSVIDESKAIALGACYDGSIWDFYLGNTKPLKTLPLFTILTVPATGSEMNPNGVITNEETNDKWGFRTDLNYPVFSILDPETTLSIPLKYTVLSAVDIMTHSMEAYFSKLDTESYVIDRYVEALVKSVLESTDRLLKDPKDLEARANLMWTSTLAWNGTVACGVGRHIIINHVIEHPMSALYDITHAAGLSILIPASMKYYFKKYQKRLAAFGRNVFNICETDEEKAAKSAMEALISWYKNIGVPTSMTEAGIYNPDIEKMSFLTMKLLGKSADGLLTQDEIKDILTLAI